MGMFIEFSVIMDMLIAVILGGLIGFEREWHSKPAGLRTNMIIAGASALFVALGRIIVTDYNELMEPEGIGMDPIRLLHAVIVGVGFLGAGTIIKSTDESKVMFLTTAATIWMSAAVGLCVGLKHYLLAVGATVIMLIINMFFRFLEHLISKRNSNGK